MYTDTDLFGLGESVLEGHCNSVEAVLREFEEYLIGKDPMQDVGYQGEILQLSCVRDAGRQVPRQDPHVYPREARGRGGRVLH